MKHTQINSGSWNGRCRECAPLFVSRAAQAATVGTKHRSSQPGIPTATPSDGASGGGAEASGWSPSDGACAGGAGANAALDPRVVVNVALDPTGRREHDPEGGRDFSAVSGRAGQVVGAHSLSDAWVAASPHGGLPRLRSPSVPGGNVTEVVVIEGVVTEGIGVAAASDVPAGVPPGAKEGCAEEEGGSGHRGRGVEGGKVEGAGSGGDGGGWMKQGRRCAVRAPLDLISDGN